MERERKIQKTGIPGLDKILGNGIPEGHVVLIQGDAGSGKTMLSMQWLFKGWEEEKTPGLYIAGTEAYQKAIRNIQDIGFFDEKYLNEGYIRFTDLRSMTQIMGWGQEDMRKDNVEELINRIKELVEKNGTKRLVIDSITALGYIIDNKELFRHFIFRLGTIMDTLGCTVFLTSEARESTSQFQIEDFISDGIIHMEQVPGEQRLLRHLNIQKMRGVEYRSGKVAFIIDTDGITIYPKIPIDRQLAKTTFKERKSSGVSGLDEMLGGGFPEGHNILFTGNTGTGKSTLGMEFLREGLKNGEVCLFVNLEEPLEQVKKTAEAHGWDFDRYEEEGLLKFISPDLIDTFPDKFLYQIINTVDEYDVERVLIDSISSLPSAGMSKDKVREILLQLNSSLKKRGVTSVMTFLSSSMFSFGGQDSLGKTVASDLRLSSIVDGIILMRYVERDNSIGIVLNVLKMRGIGHSKDIQELIIDKDGVSIGSKL
ncbi:MAG: ATPase domain-containing protein [Thermoplasmata archaeon]